jgi:lipoprotein-anchoring transpeptidase ErfK/SrfK/putative cell wall-binding protein
LILVSVALLAAVPAAPVVAADAWPTGSYQVSLNVERLAGADRYQTAVAIAKRSYPSWSGIDHVVVASGEDSAMVDALVAGSLCWAYDAPLLLVKSSGVPSSVRTALQEMRSVNSTVTVTVVGGTAAVTAPAITELGALVGAENVSQPWTTGNRYTTAAGVAGLVSAVAAETGRTIPARAFVVNGSGAGGFADAFTASAVAAATGIPIMLVEKGWVPAETKAALAAAAPGSVIVVGGTGVVSDAAYTAAGGTSRWAGANRYATAVVMASGARNRGWLTGPSVGIASAGPDALTGAVHIGRSGGPLLHAGRTAIDRDTARYLHNHRGVISGARLFGGTGVLSTGLVAELKGTPTQPRIVQPSAGTRLAKKARVVVSTGVNTTRLRVFAGSTLVADRQAGSFATIDLGVLPTPSEGFPLRVYAMNPAGAATLASANYLRHSYPAPNSIVVDKSDFRLYLFRDDVFVKSYPVAIGRTNAETPVALWRIDSKYYTDPSGVYGPRKMRMYRKSGSRYVYTAYNIHGTNNPASIGTKASAGCIRLYNSDILDLFPRVPLGTIVQTRE